MGSTFVQANSSCYCLLRCNSHNTQPWLHITSESGPLRCIQFLFSVKRDGLFGHYVLPLDSLKTLFDQGGGGGGGGTLHMSRVPQPEMPDILLTGF